MSVFEGPFSAVGRGCGWGQKPPVAPWGLTAKTDKYSYPTSRTMIEAAKAPTSLTATVLSSGRHHPMFWLPHVPAAMAWLGTAVPGFAP